MEHINKKAFFDYEVLERYESGIELIGSEVKSIFRNNVNLKGSFCKFFNGELFVFDMHISAYEHNSSWTVIEEKRNRKLLLKRKELNKLSSKVEQDGLTIIPLKIYFNERNKCKVEIGLCKGKKNYDKREDSKQKTIRKDIEKDFKFKIK